MTKEEILAGLKVIFANIRPQVDSSTIGMDSKLLEDLYLDSLSMLLMSLAIEQKFNFQFETQTPFTTVGEVVEYVADRLV